MSSPPSPRDAWCCVYVYLVINMCTNETVPLSQLKIARAICSGCRSTHASSSYKEEEIRMCLIVLVFLVTK